MAAICCLVQRITELLPQHKAARKMEMILTQNEAQNQSKDPQLLIESQPHGVNEDHFQPPDICGLRPFTG